MYHFACQQGNFISAKPQVSQQVFVYLLGLQRPLGVILVALTLMDKNPLDDSLVLGTQSTVEQTYIGDIGIGVHGVVEPCGPVAAVQFGRIVLLEEMLNTASSYGHVDDTHTDILWQALHQSTSKIITGTQSGIGTVERRIGCVPLVYLPCLAFVVARVGCLWHSCHHLEAATDSLVVACLGFGITHHVGLPKGKEYIEGGVRLTVELVVLHRIGGRT